MTRHFRWSLLAAVAAALFGCSYEGGNTRIGGLRLPGEPERRNASPMPRQPAPAAQVAAAARRSTFSGRLVEVAEDEWRRWGSQYHNWRQGGVTERTPGFRERVFEFWRISTGRTVTSVEIGWSGAFVSWAVKTAGAGERWPATASHAHYIAWATANRGKPGAAFVAHPVSAHAPKLGDLVCNALERGVSFESQPGRNYNAHCDVVVAIRPGAIDVIGGNLSDAVRKRTLVADRNGRVVDPQPAAVDPSVRRWFAIIETRL